MKTRLAHTPLTDQWIKRLNRAVREDDARADLVSFMQRMNPRSIHYWQTRLAEILNKKRPPNGEVVLTIQKWLDAMNRK